MALTFWEKQVFGSTVGQEIGSPHDPAALERPKVTESGWRPWLVWGSQKCQPQPVFWLSRLAGSWSQPVF